MRVFLKLLVVAVIILITLGSYRLYSFYNTLRYYADWDVNTNLKIDDISISEPIVNPFEGFTYKNEDNSKVTDSEPNKGIDLETEQIESNNSMDSSTGELNDQSSSSDRKIQKPKNTKATSTYDDLVELYSEKFLDLQVAQKESLDELIQQGIEDYNSNKGKITALIRLSNKYLGRANELEKQSDEDFQVLLQEFESKLKAKSFDTSIIEELDTFYQQYKNQLRNELLRKAKQHL